MLNLSIPNLCIFYGKEGHKEPDTKEKMKSLLELVTSLSAVLPLLTDWVFLYMKSHEDVLQGISKLDHLIKVSVI